MKPITPVILCGGGGARLWPLSNPRTPKQFLKLMGDQSMLAETAARVGDPSRFGQVLAIGSERHHLLLRTTLPEARLLLEPTGRNSAPAIAAACLMSAPDAILIVLPADHHIQDVKAFHAAIDRSLDAALRGAIVTFGITADYPATGYGYIEAEGGADVRPVRRFVEKPDYATAQSYIEAGSFFWNAGIFLFRADTMLDAFTAHASDILDDVRTALNDGALDREAFGKVRSESIDYAVLEHADDIVVTPVSMGWSDLGDFRTLHAIGAREQGEDVITLGPIAVADSSQLFARSEGPRVAVYGLDDIAIIATPEDVLVTRLSKASEIREVTTLAQASERSVIRPDQRARLGDWLWGAVLPYWAERAVASDTGAVIEALGFDGAPITNRPMRGRVPARQLFAFARAKRLGWNPDGAADAVIEGVLRFMDGPARVSPGGWGHLFNGVEVIDPRRDLYDHAFIALAASELAALGDRRGDALAEEAFAVIDTVFRDADGRGWHDPETALGVKRSNPHMHLLEASLAYFEVRAGAAELARIEEIAILFERWMFDPATGAVREDFGADWQASTPQTIEPGHAFEWAFLLDQTRRMTGRDTASWVRRLIVFAESEGLAADKVVDQLDASTPSFRLWPQLERFRALCWAPRSGGDPVAVLDQIIEHYLSPGPVWGWVDQIDAAHRPMVDLAPASMLYHLMTGIAPFADKP